MNVSVSCLTTRVYCTLYQSLDGFGEKKETKESKEFAFSVCAIVFCEDFPTKAKNTRSELNGAEANHASSAVNLKIGKSPLGVASRNKQKTTFHSDLHTCVVEVGHCTIPVIQNINQKGPFENRRS